MSDYAIEINNLIKNFEIKEEGRTIFLTTHYMEEADQLSDRIAIIDHGKIIALDTPHNLKNSLSKNTMTVLELDNWNLVGRSIFSLFITTINALTVALLIWVLFGFNIGSGIMPAIITLIPMLIALYGLGFGIASLVMMQ